MIQNTDFTATTAYPLFLRSYSRTSVTGAKETAKEAKDRAIRGLQDFGLLTDKELELVREYFYKNIVFVSGRWFWIGGTDWVKQQKNFIGAYNCASVPVDSWEAFRFNFRALLMGCGVGTVVEEHIINQLPEIKYPIEVKEVIELGSQWDEDNIFESSNYTYSLDSDSKALIIKYKVGDSKEGWVDIATDLLKFASFDFSYNFENVKYEKIHLYLDLSEVRPAGKTLKGFGGLSNPEKLEEGLKNIIKILNTSVGRKLNSLEICKILAIHGVIAVSGNIRRCIAYGERVSAISGMIPIQDIKVGDLVLTSSGEYRPVKNVFNQGEQEIVEVRTPTTSIKCTSNHRVAVFDSLNSYTWKYAGKLIKGDRLVSVPHKKGSMTTTTDWAWLVGFFLGDGHADIASAKRRNGGGGSVVFAMSTPRLKGELGKKVLQILVGMGYTPTSRIKENTAFICVYKKELAEELGQYKWSWATPIIPEWVWNGTVEIRSSFLAGLSDADGAPSGNVLLNSTKLEFLRNVQKLALSLGIATGWKSSIAPSTKIKRDINYDTLLEKGLVNSNWIPLEVQFVAPIGTAKTFDIEVEDDHEFIASGLLVHNSARINQGTPSDKFFSESKDNLWIQDDQGNWKIDPDRDMLRFGNHTLCYHNKPDLETIIEAVRKQYYSGEGAIQYVPEAIARGNVDLLNTSEKKLEFIALYCQSRRDGSNYLLSLKEMDSKELEHRMQRYSSNPCLIGDTLIATANGLVPIQDLAGKTFETSVDLRTIGLSGVIQTQAIAFSTGVKAIYEVKLANGLSVKSTSNHQHFTDKGWVETKNLTYEHKVLFQQGEGKWSEDSKNNINSEQSQMLGWWYGDGYNVKMKSRSKNRAEYLAKGFVFNPKEYLTAGTTVLYALETITEHRYIPRLHKGVYEFKSCSLKLSDWFDRLNVQTKEELPVSFFQERRETIIGFLQGLFSADGSVGNINKAVARQALLVNKSKKFIEQIQILLLNLGIISSTRCAVKSGAKGVPYTLKDSTKKISNNNGSYTLSIFAESFNRFVEVIGFPLCPLKQEQADLWVEKPLINYLEETINKRYSSNVVSVKEVGEETVYDLHVPLTNSFIANGIVTHNCFEVLGEKFLCNLSQVHLNNLDPNNELQQVEAFKASTLAALPLLSHEFDIEDFKYSREIDPIIGISFTGLFDFFVNKFGADWLLWWKTGRSKDYSEAQYFLDTERYYLELWKNSVKETVEEYCKRHNIKQPNRYSVVQPSGSVSLLTNASAGWHAPKATRYIRRITFSSNSPIVSASKDYGYNIVPSQSCKDENGNLLNDINDPRVNEVLIEIPVEVSWASIADKADYNPSENTVLAQLDFFMQVQKYYATHTVSATIELTEAEIEPLGTAIYNLIQNDEGYISAALLARFDALETFPRLPFEPITHEKYLKEMQAVKNRQISTDFVTLVNQYSKGFDFVAESGSTGCDSDKCLMPEKSK